MKIDIPVSNYESIKVIPDGKCPHPRYTIRNKTDAMFSTGFKDTIIIHNGSGEHRFLGREVKQLPDVIKNILFSTHYNNSIVSETSINTDNVLQILDAHMFPKLDTVECSVCCYDNKDIWVNESGVQSFFTKEEFWSNSSMLYLQNIINVVSKRYARVGINIDGISLHVLGNPFTNIYNKNSLYKIYEGISRMYIDYCEQNNPITEDSYMIDYVLYVEPTKSIEKLRKLAFDYHSQPGWVSPNVDLEEVIKILKPGSSEVSQINTKVKLNTIFTVIKNGREYKWKVIKHPCFNDLTLVRDYGGMINGVCDKDYNHVCGKTTLDTAYKDAFVLS